MCKRSAEIKYSCPKVIKLCQALAEANPSHHRFASGRHVSQLGIKVHEHLDSRNDSSSNRLVM